MTKRKFLHRKIEKELHKILVWTYCRIHHYYCLSKNFISKRSFSFSLTSRRKKYAHPLAAKSVGDWRQQSATAKPFEDSFYYFPMFGHNRIRNPVTISLIYTQKQPRHNNTHNQPNFSRVGGGQLGSSSGKLGIKCNKRFENNDVNPLNLIKIGTCVSSLGVLRFIQNSDFA